jgi:predicted GNAT family acetyltransferase
MTDQYWDLLRLERRVMDNNQKTREDQKLDEALAETFPASDPPANTVETGIRIDITPGRDVLVNDNRAAHRFELVVDGQMAFLTYERTHDRLTLVHTEVPPPLRGQHLAAALVKAGLHTARTEGLQIVVVCPFAKAYLRKHPADKQ